VVIKRSYILFEFCFSQYDKVKKHAHLAPFLTPIQLPLDISMTQRDDILTNLAKQYQSLQEEFKEVHMLYEEAKKKDYEMGGELIKEEIENSALSFSIFYFFFPLDKECLVSEGKLWTTNDLWTVRVWSLAKGNIAFGEGADFNH
jgi:hypothetical protein